MTIKLKATAVKKRIYLTLATILGLFLAIIVESMAESYYLLYAIHQGIRVRWFNLDGLQPIALPWYLVGLILLTGLFGGHALGEKWWQLIYVQHKWHGWRKAKSV